MLPYEFRGLLVQKVFSVVPDFGVKGGDVSLLPQQKEPRPSPLSSAVEATLETVAKRHEEGEILHNYVKKENTDYAEVLLRISLIHARSVMEARGRLRSRWQPRSLHAVRP